MGSSWFCCMNWLYGDTGVGPRHTRIIESPEVQLDTARMGQYETRTFVNVKLAADPSYDIGRGQHFVVPF